METVTTADPTSQFTGNVTTPDQSLEQEVRSAMESLLGPMSKIYLGLYNVRTMYETSQLSQVISEMKRYRLDSLGISEC